MVDLGKKEDVRVALEALDIKEGKAKGKKGRCNEMLEELLMQYKEEERMLSLGLKFLTGPQLCKDLEGGVIINKVCYDCGIVECFHVWLNSVYEPGWHTSSSPSYFEISNISSVKAHDEVLVFE